ncbi:Thioredoxin-like fold domain-containing protein [Strongyloides ratti]|uniref:Thioredoxin-like fold domain-containing protein n=1 Tax=Strongyloides ratti TaxID=34506 RepID=A0A090LHP8_STRRB|nr:Thioredoxin-like fold domain-containing protein [Strongyloides ratti]CEF67040.1 Thioredoxin-like fold domain-containing protein [Strongyloides ratti]
MRKLKISYFFDIIHPQSYIGYQLLKKSTSILSNNFDVNVEFFPISSKSFFQSKNIVNYENIPQNQRNLLNHEMENICKHYSLDCGNNLSIDRTFSNSFTSIFYLLMNKREYPLYYVKLIEAFFEKTWKNRIQIKNGYQFFKISLEVGMPFAKVDDLVSRTENEINKKEYKSYYQELIQMDNNHLPITNFQFLDDPEKKMTIDSVMKFVILYDKIEKDSCSLEKVIEEYCKY